MVRREIALNSWGEGRGARQYSCCSGCDLSQFSGAATGDRVASASTLRIPVWPILDRDCITQVIPSASTGWPTSSCRDQGKLKKAKASLQRLEKWFEPAARQATPLDARDQGRSLPIGAEPWHGSTIG
jgi:hypothetical protein